MQQYSNLKRFLVALIPFAVIIPKLAKIIWGKYYEEHHGQGKVYKKTQGFFWLNMSLSMLIFSFALFYSLIAGGSGSLNYKRWAEIDRQREFARQKYEETVLNKAFKKVDLDNDGVIKKSEFDDLIINSYLESRDTYSTMNSWLNLDVEWVNPDYRKDK